MDQATMEADAFIEAYESALMSGQSVDLATFLPGKEHADYERIAIELMRVGLELGARGGQSDLLTDYLSRFSTLLSNPRYRKELAFEDYRLRKHAGESVTPAEYCERFQIDTDDWGSTGAISHDASTLSVEDLGEVPLRLMLAVQRYPSVGDTFAGFQLKREIGHGTFGKVFVATQGELARRQVVVKITCHRSIEPERLSRLQHTSIVPIYSVHHVDKLMAVCMPYFGATTLSDVLEKVGGSVELPNTGEVFGAALCESSHDDRDSSGEVTSRSVKGRLVNAWQDLEKLSYVEACVWIVREIAGGLAHAHHRGIIHQDLKPANVLMANDGRPMLLDFNASRDAKREAAATFLVGGTLPYMAPEQLRSLDKPGSADPRSDLFSLGVLLFQLLTLRLPYPDRSWANPARCIADRENGPPNVRVLQPRASAAVDAIVQRCLKPNPKHRYQTADELYQDLDRQLRNLPLCHAGNPSWVERVAKWRRRNPRVMTSLKIVGLCALLMVAVSWALSSRHQRLEQLRSHALERSISLRDELQSMYVSLGVCEVGDDAFITAWQRTTDYTQTYGPDFSRLELNPLFLHLPNGERANLRECLSELLYLRAEAQRKLAVAEPNAKLRLRQIHQALGSNAHAISLNEPGRVPRVLKYQRDRLSALIVGGENHGPMAAIDHTAEFALDVSQVEIPVGNRQNHNRTESSLIPAIEALQNGRFQKALDILQVVRHDYPVSYSTWLLLGNAHVGLGQFDQADHCYTTAAALWRSSYIPYWLRGLERLSCQRYDDAIADFNAVLELKPNDSNALLNRAVARYQLEDFAAAEEDLTLALDQGAKQTRLYFLRARVREKLGMSAGAASDRQEGLRRVPTDEQSWIARGVARLSDDLRGALDDFQQARQLNPNSRPAMRNVAYVFGERFGRTEQALTVLNRLVSIDGAHADDIVSRGVYHARLGNRPEALADAQWALDTSGSDKTHYQVACIYGLTTRIEPMDANRAFHYLGRALLMNRHRWANLARTDPDLEAIRKEERFAELLRAAETFEQNVDSVEGTEK